MPKYLSNVDLNRNQLQNAVIQPLATPPTTPVIGLIYYNTSTNRFYGYNGTDWIPMDALGATMTGANIVSALNLSTSIIDNDNLSTGANTAITKAHDAVTVSDTSSVNLTLTGQAISADVIFGTTATTATAGNDARLSNSRTPTSHASTHITSGSDAIPSFTSTASGLVPLSGGGTVKYLRADGTWVTPPDTVYSLPVASATLGGVKSGTDITVDASGNVSVVDDSHNHVTGNIDGLDATLATFATTTVAQGYATTAENNAKGYADTAITNLLGSAPTTLDTLNELATALGNDPNFATTIATNIASKTSKYTTTVGDGVALSYVITHNKNSRDVVVALRETAAPYATVYTDIEMTTVNTVTVYFSTIPTSGQYTITVIG